MWIVGPTTASQHQEACKTQVNKLLNAVISSVFNGWKTSISEWALIWNMSFNRLLLSNPEVMQKDIENA